MKKLFKLPIVAIVCSFSVAATLTSCKDDKTPAPTNTITDIVSRDANFSNLKDAVVKAGLADALKGGSLTVFAPSNTYLPASVVAAKTAAELKNIIEYHAIGSKILSGSVPAGPNAKVTVLNGDSVFVTRDARGVFVNGINVASADIAADNGVIHAIAGLLLPPSGTLTETVVATAGLDSLEKAVLRVNASFPGFLNTLDGNTLTVFAPTNNAFTALLQALGTNNINNIDINTLANVLRYHVTVGRAFSSDLRAGQLPMFLSNSNTTIALSGGTNNGPTIKGSSSASNVANIISTNIMCRRAVVHLIDKVLLP